MRTCKRHVASSADAAVRAMPTLCQSTCSRGLNVMINVAHCQHIPLQVLSHNDSKFALCLLWHVKGSVCMLTQLHGKPRLAI